MLRISTGQMYQQGLDGILKNQAKMSRTQEQISTGRRILRPSDDPAGSTQVLELNRAARTVEQYQKNADRAQNRLELVDNTLSGITTMLQRVNELALQGSSGTYNAAQRDMIAVEVRGMLSSVLDLANTTDSAGDYLFSGFQGKVKPFAAGAGTYTFSGDTGLREIRISADRTVADSESGFHTFMDVPTAAGGVRDLFSTIDQIATALEADTSPDTLVADISSAIARIGEVHASVGSKQRSIDEQRDINEGFILTLETNRSKLEDVDIAEAITNFNKEKVALEAAQASFAQMQGLLLFNFIR
ncbi:MAG: flagellar hook-associated protein FlgL [Candidatus Sedimenticola sp. (ex Thyasira tokunagai)]